MLPRITLEQIREVVIRKVKIGQTIRIIERADEDPPRLKVAAFYPNFILCKGKGYNTCFSYHDFWLRLQPRQDINIPEYIKGWRSDKRRT
jgi:hypothetical protein